MDDVERYVGTGLNYSLAALQSGLPHFFRLAVCISFVFILAITEQFTWQFTSDGTAGDFTKAATLLPNATWVDPPSGPS